MFQIYGLKDDDDDKKTHVAVFGARKKLKA